MRYSLRIGAPLRVGRALGVGAPGGVLSGVALLARLPVVPPGPGDAGRDALLQLFDAEFHRYGLLSGWGPAGTEETADPMVRCLRSRAQLPCESWVLLPGCGLLPFDTSLPGFPLLSPRTPWMLSGGIRCSSSSSFRLFRFIASPHRVPA